MLKLFSWQVFERKTVNQKITQKILLILGQLIICNAANATPNNRAEKISIELRVANHFIIQQPCGNLDPRREKIGHESDFESPPCYTLD